LLDRIDYSISIRSHLSAINAFIKHGKELGVIPLWSDIKCRAVDTEGYIDLALLKESWMVEELEQWVETSEENSRLYRYHVKTYLEFRAVAPEVRANIILDLVWRHLCEDGFIRMEGYRPYKAIEAVNMALSWKATDFFRSRCGDDDVVFGAMIIPETLPKTIDKLIIEIKNHLYETLELYPDRRDEIQNKYDKLNELNHAFYKAGHPGKEPECIDDEALITGISYVLS
jgi:hypothetical protein